MKKEYIAGIGFLAAIFLIVGGFAYGSDLGQIINNYNGETVVNQSVIGVEPVEEELGFSNQRGGYVITKTATTGTIATTTATTGLDLTNTVMGSLVLSELVISNNFTATAGCTGLKVTAEGYATSTDVMVVTSIATLGAGKTLDFSKASSSVKTLLTEGANLQVLPLGDLPCTGGTLTFTMFFDKVDERSFIYE